MTNPMKKTADQSATSQVQILFPGDTNGFGRLFGGQLMQWIDVVAAVVARRHSNCNVTTAAVERLDFKAPAFANDTIVLDGRMTYVGRTSMEVRVNTFVEALDGKRSLINTAYLTLVAIDAHQNPVPVPGLELVTEQDRLLWAQGQARRQQRKIDSID